MLFSRGNHRELVRVSVPDNSLKMKKSAVKRGANGEIDIDGLLADVDKRIKDATSASDGLEDFDTSDFNPGQRQRKQNVPKEPPLTSSSSVQQNNVQNKDLDKFKKKMNNFPYSKQANSVETTVDNEESDSESDGGNEVLLVG